MSMQIKDHYLTRTPYEHAPYACVIVYASGVKIESQAFKTKIEAEKELERLLTRDNSS